MKALPVRYLYVTGLLPVCCMSFQMPRTCLLCVYSVGVLMLFWTGQVDLYRTQNPEDDSEDYEPRTYRDSRCLTQHLSFSLSQIQKKLYWHDHNDVQYCQSIWV